MSVDSSLEGGAATHDHRVGTARIVVSRVLGVASLASYNWWVGVLLGTHLLTSPNGFFSDLAAVGQPHAELLSNLDVAAGLLMVAALVLRGRNGPAGARPEWPLLVTFAVAGAVGGKFPYQCPEGASAACRAAEWHLQLPWPHYVHILAGIVEFASATLAVLAARRRTAAQRDPVGRVVRGIGWVLVVAYPLLAVSYLTVRLGAFVEPVFFVCFSVMAAVELFERQRA
ncbi:MAG TPA: DUF998 domain-containing protein [Actinomycetes bacterium]